MEAIITSRRSKGSRLTHRLPIQQVQKVLSAIEAEAAMSVGERSAIRKELKMHFRSQGSTFRAADRLAKMTIGSWRNCLLIALPLYCGYRRSDVVKLRWADLVYVSHEGNIKVHETVIVFNEQKTKKRREIHISDDLAMYVIKHFNDSKVKDLSKYVFESPFGPERHIMPASMLKIVGLTFARFGVYDEDGMVAPHSLRKTYGYYMWKTLGGDFAAAVQMQQVFGHSDLKITMRYLDLKSQEMKSAHNTLSFRL